MFKNSGGGTGVPSVPAGDSPRYELVQVSLKGPLAALQAMVKTFYSLGYALSWGQWPIKAQWG